MLIRMDKIPSTVEDLRGMENYERFTFFKGPGRGLQAKVAQQAQVDQSLVSRVCSGTAQSARVEECLNSGLAQLAEDFAEGIR